MTDGKQGGVDEQVMRRISGALDAEGGLDADAELRELLDRDPEALRYAQDLVRMDEVLASFAARASEPDWDALAACIDERLDADAEALPPLDIDEPPRFLDADETRDPSVGRELAVAPAASEVRESPSARGRDAQPAPVVDLAARRRRSAFAWTGGLAAAAAVGLGILFGTTTFDEAPAASRAAVAPAEESVAPGALADRVEVPSQPPAWGETAELEVEEPTALPAAAAAQPLGEARGGAAPAPARLPMRLDRMAAQPRRARERAAPARREVSAEAAQAPSRAEILASLESVEPRVQRCLARVGEVARVTLRVGAAGNVVSARVDPPYTGADATCIVDALRAARLAPSPDGYAFMHAFRPAPVAGGSLARPPNAARARRARPAAPRAEPAAEAEPADNAWSD